MATIIFVRKGPKSYNTASSREVSVNDVLHLYGTEAANYTFMKTSDPDDLHAGEGQERFFSDPEHVVVKIEREETAQDIFTRAGFYMVNEAKP